MRSVMSRPQPAAMSSAISASWSRDAPAAVPQIPQLPSGYISAHLVTTSVSCSRRPSAVTGAVVSFGGVRSGTVASDIGRSLPGDLVIDVSAGAFGQRVVVGPGDDPRHGAVDL